MRRKDFTALRDVLKQSVENGYYRDPTYWRRVDNIAAISKDWDRFLATIYSIPELRRHPDFLKIALRRQWTTKGSRVRREIPYPNIYEIQREIEDMGYVPDAVATKVSLLSRQFPEFRALDLYLRRNGRYAFRMLVTNPESLETFLRFVHAYENVHGRLPGKQVIEKVHKIFPDLHAHHTLAPREMEELLLDAKEVGNLPELIRDDLREIAQRQGVLHYFVSDEDYAHLPTFLAYLRKYRNDILSLPADPEELLDYKFGHVSKNLRDRIAGLAETLKRRRMLVPVFDPQPLLRALNDAALAEQLRSKSGDEFVQNLRSAYEKMQAGNFDLSPGELQAIRSKKLAEKHGLAETRRILEKLYDRQRTSSGILSLATTVPQHFGAMAVGSSCYRPDSGTDYALGAVGSAGGPVLTFFVRDPITGRAIAHQTYNLFQFGSEYRFVPNGIYGTENDHLFRVVGHLLEEHGIPVHHGSDVPPWARPAESRHSIRDFYSDSHGRKMKFRRWDG